MTLSPVVTPEFRSENARFLAVASDLAYSIPPELRPGDDSAAAHSLAAELGLEGHGFGSAAGPTDTQGFVGWSISEGHPFRFRVLAFRGTEPRQFVDWLVDARALQTRDETLFGGRLHIGFHAALLSVWQDVCRILASRADAVNWPLFVTGHSLGGALATLASCPPKGPGCVGPL